MKTFEKQIISLSNEINHKDKHIERLEKEIKHLNNKITKIKEIEESTLVLSEKVLPIEHIKQAEKEHFKCTHCDFQSSSKAGLRFHMKMKHTDYTKEEFPRSCDQCDKIVNNISDMKKHLKTHSYKDIQFQCSFCHFCNFCSGEQI